MVAEGNALDAAVALAADIAGFPQVCMRSDRKSLYEGGGLAMDDAVAHEFRLGVATISSGEAQEGARRFTSDKGRHGDFGDL